MIATPVDALPKGPLPRPTLVITRNCVAEALEHLQALRKLYAEMRAMELEKIRKGLVVVVKVAPCVRAYKAHGVTKYDDLLR